MGHEEDIQSSVSGGKVTHQCMGQNGNRVDSKVGEKKLGFKEVMWFPSSLSSSEHGGGV